MDNTYAEVTTLRNTPKQAAAEFNREVKAMKAEQLAAAKAQRAEFKFNKATAKELYAKYGEAMIKKYTTEKITKATAKDYLHFIKIWEPEKFIELANKFAADGRE